MRERSIRAFLALGVPEVVRSQLDRQRRPLVDELPRARWVRPEGQHLTLKFLGDIDREVASALARDLRRELLQCAVFAVRLGGGGFFPTRQKPRVAWVGGSANGVQEIVEIVERVCSEHGFTREPRQWSLHLTQARLNRAWPRWAILRFLEWGEALSLDPFDCVEVVLYASDLRPGGAVYTAKERMALS